MIIDLLYLNFLVKLTKSMYKLIDVPIPPQSHFVGILFLYEEDGIQKILTVKDKNSESNHINLKLPGGTSERLYEEYVLYENALFKTLEKLKFNKNTLAKIFKNEIKRKRSLEEHKGLQALAFILRTMVMESLEEIGYYPMDLDPLVVDVVEKDYHTQYFVEVKNFIDANGDEIVIPNMDDNFKPLDSDVIETRVPLDLSDFQKLIHSHKKAAEKFFQLHKKKPST